MKLNFFIAKRYLTASRRENFLSVITLYAISGVTIGVAALIIVISVMSGFEHDLQKKVLGMNGDIIVTNFFGQGIAGYVGQARNISKVKGIKAVAPFIYAQSMIQSSANISGAIVRGVEYSNFMKVSDALGQIQAGPSDTFAGAIIGIELARKLSVFVGDTVYLITNIQPTAIGYQPTSEALPVTAIFNSGMYEYDANIVFVSLPLAQQLFNLPGVVTGFEIKSSSPFAPDIVKERLKKILPYPFQIKTWKDINRNLFSAMKLEKVTMFIILMLIIVIAGFNIISTIVMTVLEKRKEIALLKAIGLNSNRIKSIFLYQGLIMSGIGVVLGNLIGLGVCLLLKRYQFIHLPQNVYYISKLPVYINPSIILIISLSTLAISFISALYPATQASKILPAEGLRDE